MACSSEVEERGRRLTCPSGHQDASPDFFLCSHLNSMTSTQQRLASHRACTEGGGTDPTTRRVDLHTPHRSTLHGGNTQSTTSIDAVPFRGYGSPYRMSRHTCLCRPAPPPQAEAIQKVPGPRRRRFALLPRSPDRLWRYVGTWVFLRAGSRLGMHHRIGCVSSPR